MSSLEGVVDVGNPLRTIAPTVDTDVLQALARTHRPLNGAMVARLTGRSYAQTRACLHRLTAHGLLHAEDVGPAVQYRLNRDHVLAGPVLAIVAAPNAVEEWVAERVNGWTHPAVAVVLFGSWARGEADADSDLDLLLVRDDVMDADGPWGGQVHTLGEELEALTGNPLQFVQVTRSQLRQAVREGQPLIANVRSDGRVLVGPAVRDLLTAGVRA